MQCKYGGTQVDAAVRVPPLVMCQRSQSCLGPCQRASPPAPWRGWHTLGVWSPYWGAGRSAPGRPSRSAWLQGRGGGWGQWCCLYPLGGGDKFRHYVLKQVYGELRVNGSQNSGNQEKNKGKQMTNYGKSKKQTLLFKQQNESLHLKCPQAEFERTDEKRVDITVKLEMRNLHQKSGPDVSLSTSTTQHTHTHTSQFDMADFYICALSVSSRWFQSCHKLLCANHKLGIFKSKSHKHELQLSIRLHCFLFTHKS